jgi:hypothetical protein
VTGPATPAGPRRPPTVTAASALLIAMGGAGLAYAVAALAITPSTVAAFRAAAAGSGATTAEVDGIVSWVWWVAGIGLLLAVLLFALLVALGLGVRRGSSGARTGTFVVAGLGLLCGCGAALTTTLQRATPFDLPGTGLSSALAGAYPGGWIWLNVALAGGQILGYVVVTVLLIAAPGGWFAGRAAGTPVPTPPSYGPPGPPARPSYDPPSYGPPGAVAPSAGPGPNVSAPAEPPPPHDDRWAPPSG